MKCIAVYTNDFERFSDIYDKVIDTPLGENEEKEVEGVVIGDSGEVPDHYLQRMKEKRNVVVMKEKDRDITILQRGDIFEILIPENTPVSAHQPLSAAEAVGTVV